MSDPVFGLIEAHKQAQLKHVAILERNGLDDDREAGRGML